MPPVPIVGANLIEYFFELGPVKKDSAVEAADIPGWEHVLGVEFHPWQSRALIKMSRSYHMEMHSSTDWDAPPPWRKAARQWNWARSRQNLDAMQQDAVKGGDESFKSKRKARNGNRQ